MSELVSKIVQIDNAKDHEIATLKQENATLKQELMAKNTDTAEYCTVIEKYECQCGASLAKYQPPSSVKLHEKSGRHVAYELGLTKSAASENIKIQMENPAKKINKSRSQRQKEYTAKCRRNCECGGKTSILKSISNEHVNSAKHKKYELSQTV